MDNITKVGLGIWWGTETTARDCILPVSNTPVIGLSSTDKLKIIEWLLLEEPDRKSITAFLHRKYLIEGS